MRILRDLKREEEGEEGDEDDMITGECKIVSKYGDLNDGERSKNRAIRRVTSFLRGS